MMRNLPRLAGTVQRNCDISDARYAGDYGLCTFLLKMREYYRWQSDLPFSRTLPKHEIGDWLASRERMWDRIEADAFAPLPLAPGALDPFEAVAANRALLPQGCVYGAGYGRFHKPVFFLGKLLRVEQRAGYTILISSREYARELAAPPAMLQGRTIYVRKESVCRYLWEKIEEWQWRKQGSAMARALAGYDFSTDVESALVRMADNEIETMVLHELGEAMAGELLGETWGEMAIAVTRTRGEAIVRAVRDLLADCISTLPALLARANLPALHFHFATFDAPRRQFFPQALAAYERFSRSGDLDPLRQVVQEGKARWLATAQGLLALAPAAREAGVNALLEDDTARAPQRGAVSAAGATV
jgi:hypothetical protein